MPGRNSDSTYQFGFNGKENLDDVKGEGKLQDYGMRIYDPRLAKFISVDPLQKEYPMYSTYHFSGNSPSLMVDMDGLEPSLSQMTDNYLSKHWWGVPIKMAEKSTHSIANASAILVTGFGIAMSNFASQIANGNFETFRNEDNFFKPAVYKLNPVTWNLEEMEGGAGEFLPFKSTGREVLQVSVDIPLMALPVEKISEIAGKQIVKYAVDKLIEPNNKKSESQSTVVNASNTQVKNHNEMNKNSNSVPQKKASSVSKNQSNLYKPVQPKQSNRCEKAASFN